MDVKLKVPGVEVSGCWELNSEERRAAWELYVELVTRVSAVPLREDEGLLREALGSLYSLFETMQEILCQHGPDIPEPKRDVQYNFGYLAVAMLNYGVRPLLAHWHPALEDWEHRRPVDRSRRDHKLAWSQSGQLLTAYADLLAAACGVPNLIAAIPTHE